MMIYQKMYPTFPSRILFGQQVDVSYLFALPSESIEFSPC